MKCLFLFIPVNEVAKYINLLYSRADYKLIKELNVLK